MIKSPEGRATLANEMTKPLKLRRHDYGPPYSRTDIVAETNKAIADRLMTRLRESSEWKYVERNDPSAYKPFYRAVSILLSPLEPDGGLFRTAKLYGVESILRATGCEYLVRAVDEQHDTLASLFETFSEMYGDK